jgi:hypothetical protein
LKLGSTRIDCASSKAYTTAHFGQCLTKSLSNLLGLQMIYKNGTTLLFEVNIEQIHLGSESEVYEVDILHNDSCLKKFVQLLTCNMNQPSILAKINKEASRLLQLYDVWTGAVHCCCWELRAGGP